MSTPQRRVIEGMFQIVDKNARTVPFILNPAQRALDDAFHRRMLIPKARQEGVSSYWLAYFAVECLSKQNTRAVVISHETEATQRMLAKVEFYLENLRGPKPVIATHNKNELSFPKTNSVFYIGTAGAKKFGRGDTITHLLASEIAYWPDPKSLAAGLFQAVPIDTGTLIVESTGNGAGNYYHNLCMRAAKGASSFRLFFLPWQTFPEYRKNLSPEEAENVLRNLDDSTDEPDLVRKYNLDAGQLAFRRDKLEEFDYDLQKWYQEYPSNLDDCFQVAGGGIFQRVNFQPTPEWKKRDLYLWALEGHPRADRMYLIGGDVSAGVRKDSSVLEVFDLETMEQVGEWISNRTDPDALARHAVAVGTTFNKAFIAVEANNHGILTLSELKKSKYPQERIYRVGSRGKKPDPAIRLSNMGVRTTTANKPLMIGTLRRMLSKGEMLIHSEVLKNELSTFIEDEAGKMGAQEGCFDDTVMASAVAAYVAPRATLTMTGQERSKMEHTSTKPEDDPTTFDHYLAQKEAGRGEMYGIPGEYGVERTTSE